MMVRVTSFTRVALSFVAGVCVVIMYYNVAHREQTCTQKIVLTSTNEILQSDKETTRQPEVLRKARAEKNDGKRPDCRTRREFRVVKVPQLEPKIWDGVRLVLLFIGYRRSGHSLVAALLDAHPNIILADETHSIKVWRTFPNETRTRDRFFRVLYERSFKLAAKGERSADDCDPNIGYKYHVPHQWQGRFDKSIQIIGDKEGPGTIRALEFQPNNRNLFPEMKRRLKTAFKFIHVVRNPFDIVATQILRERSNTITAEERSNFFKNPYKASKEEQCTVAKDHAKLTSGVVNLIKRYGDDVITVYSEDMIKNPSKEMKRLCKFLSVSCSEDYVKDCSSIVHGSPSKTRNTILWKDEAKDIINKLISDTPMLQRYKFVED